MLKLDHLHKNSLKI